MKTANTRFCGRLTAANPKARPSPRKIRWDFRRGHSARVQAGDQQVQDHDQQKQIQRGRQLPALVPEQRREQQGQHAGQHSRPGAVQFHSQPVDTQHRAHTQQGLKDGHRPDGTPIQPVEQGGQVGVKRRQKVGGSFQAESLAGDEGSGPLIVDGGIVDGLMERGSCPRRQRMTDTRRTAAARARIMAISDRKPPGQVGSVSAWIVRLALVKFFGFLTLAKRI